MGDSNYFISNLGKVKSFKIYKEGKILLYCKDDRGYFYVHLFKNNKSKNKRIHVLVFEAFNNYKLTNDECVHHRDENKVNNDLENLQLITKKEHNILHNKGENNPMFGKMRSGEKSGHHTLTEQNVIEIRIDLNRGKLSQREIAKKYGVSQTQISRIKNRILWKNISESDE